MGSDVSQPASPAAYGETHEAPRLLTKGLFSFKVLTECPIIIALLFQLYRKFVNHNVPLFVPLIMEV